MRILVTGASGLIGSNLVSALQQEGHTIRVTYRNHISDFGENVEYFKGDLLDLEFCTEITKNIDVVFHCAANTSGAHIMSSSPLVHVTPNVIMNAQLLEESYKSKVKKFIFMSSSSI